MRVFVFGYTGMLGRYVFTYLREQGIDVVGVGRDIIDASDIMTATKLTAPLGKEWKKGDFFINCVGAIPQRGSYSKCDFIRINSIFPHFLSEFCEEKGLHFIHATTDCVFSGYSHNYNEKSLHTAEDIYGKSKSLGEPANAIIIRTSIIGEELLNKKSLLEWVKSNKDSTVDGYTNHIWNGITCLEFAKICAGIISTENYWGGVKHIHSPVFVNKCELVQLISDVYDLNITVNPVAPGLRNDKTLMSTRNDVTIEVPELREQLEKQRDFYPILSK